MEGQYFNQQISETYMCHHVIFPLEKLLYHLFSLEETVVRDKLFMEPMIILLRERMNNVSSRYLDHFEVD